MFSPTLIQKYNELRAKGAKFEIVFFGFDQEKEAHEKYRAAQPWLAVDFEDPMKEQISDLLQITGIPTFVIANKTVARRDGREKVQTNADFKTWLS